MHTYHNTLRILCQAFQIEFEGHDHRCERLLVQEAFRIHRAGQMLVPIIDDAHLMPAESLRKLQETQLQIMQQTIRAGADNRLSLDNVEIQSWVLVRAQIDALARAQRALGELEDAVQRPVDPGEMFTITAESPALIGSSKDLRR